MNSTLAVAKRTEPGKIILSGNVTLFFWPRPKTKKKKKENTSTLPAVLFSL